ncbi:MAG: outer membrane protein assembly factor BamD, partial [Desulfobacterales bacterium]
MKNSGCILLACFVLFGCTSSQGMSQIDLRLSAMEKLAGILQQDNTALAKELKQLNARIQQFEQSNGGNQLTIRSRIASFHANLEKLSDQVQILHGRSEEAEYLLKQISDDFEDREKHNAERIESIETTDSVNKDRLGRLETYLGFETSDPLDFPIATDLEAKDLSNKDRYTASKQAFDRGELETARQGFQILLRQFPTSDSADNAQFWIGETYFREKWYEKAILEYQKVIEKFPKGNKVPASLLKQGLAFNKLRDKA